jgi:hypothetical protein
MQLRQRLDVIERWAERAEPVLDALCLALDQGDPSDLDAGEARELLLDLQSWRIGGRR